MRLAPLALVLLPVLQACGGAQAGNGDLGAHCTTIEGDYTVENNFDVQALENAGCTTITGTLYITGGSGTVELPNLKEIGALIIQPGQFDSPQSPAAISVVKLNALTSITTTVVINGNPDLTDVEMSAVSLARVSTFQVTGNPMLPQCEVAKLQDTVPANANVQVRENGTGTCD